MERDRELWTIVLAAGDGTRLARLTHGLHGEPRPKQFAVIEGERSLLCRTLERLEPISDPQRTVVVIPAPYEDLAREQLALHHGVHVVVQPENRGTGPGVMLPLAYVLDEAPDADVLVSPCDHHFSAPRAFLSGIEEAVRALEQAPLILLGVRADSAETEYGWIRAGAPWSGPVHRLDEFIEKPPAEVAERLLREGALWNTFVMVARGRHLLALASTKLPAWADVIAARHDAAALAYGYRHTLPGNFSRDVLERCAELGVVAIEGSGWTDWGSPDRVLETIPPGPDRDRVRESMIPGALAPAKCPADPRLDSDEAAEKRA